MNFIRSRSRSITSRVAGLCTLPADAPPPTFVLVILESSNPYIRSNIRRVSCASTRSFPKSRVFFKASVIASLVISLKTILLTGTEGFKTSSKCQAIASPSRSSSVARKSSSAFFKAFFNCETCFLLLGLIS